MTDGRDDWKGGGGDALWTAVWLLFWPLVRGALLMWLLAGVHQAQLGVPALGYWWCVLAAWTVGSITGANVRRHHMNEDFDKRKKERAERRAARRVEAMCAREAAENTRLRHDARRAYPGQVV